MKRSILSLTLALNRVSCQRDAPIRYPRESSILNTETGCPGFGVSVVVYWISRKKPGIALIRPYPHPDRFLSARHKSKLML